MKEKHAAQKFRDNTLRLFHNQYKRLALRRWSTKLRAEDMLKRGTSAEKRSDCVTTRLSHSSVALSSESFCWQHVANDTYIATRVL